MKTYKGIDERIIKCCDKAEGTIEAGISFDYDDDKKVHILRFHYLDYIHGQILCQITKTMYLDKNNTRELIEELQSLSFE